MVSVAAFAAAAFYDQCKHDGQASAVSDLEATGIIFIDENGEGTGGGYGVLGQALDLVAPGGAASGGQLGRDRLT